MITLEYLRLFFGGGITHQQDNRLTSQIDLPPTLLSLIGIDNYSPMIGHDMTQKIDPSKLRAMIQFTSTPFYSTQFNPLLEMK